MSKKNEAPETLERMQGSVEQTVEEAGAAVEEADDGRGAVVAEDPVPAGDGAAADEAEGQVGEDAPGVGPDGADAQSAAAVPQPVLGRVDSGIDVLVEPSTPTDAAKPAAGAVVTCGVIRDLLPLYVDDVVGAETKTMVDAHLQACPGCQGYLDGMRSVVQIPVAPKQRMEDAKVLRALKRFIRNKRLLTGLGTAVVVFAACCLAVGLMNSYRWDVPYSEDITVYKSTDGFVCLQYTGAGHISFDSSWGDDGVMRVSCQQSFWDRYVEPIYDNALENYWLADSREVVEVHYFDTAEEMWNASNEGEVVWEADDQAKRDFYERERSLDQRQDDLEDLYRQMDEIQERIWDLENDQEWNDRVVG